MHEDIRHQLRETLAVLDAFPSDTQALRALQQLSDATDAAQAELVREVAAAESFRDDGCSTIKTWLRVELHLDDSESAALIRRGLVAAELPDVAEAARIGRIRPGHVDAFGYGLRHLGDDVMTHPMTRDALMDFASESEPAQLRAAVREMRDALAPDALEEAYLRGLDKRDLHLSRVGDGYVITGFLDIILGTKLATILESLSHPAQHDSGQAALEDCDAAEQPADELTPAERRLAGLEALCDSILEHGLPQDRGIRPHLSVHVDADEIAHVAHPENDNESGFAKAGELVGFGPVGRNVISEILCGADLTPILTTSTYRVLDVGRTTRCAPLWQRRAIEARQGSQCAAPGCRHRIRHIHHVIWYSHGGTTELPNLIGLCAPCHRLVHAGKLHIDPDTHAFTRPYRAPVRANRSNNWRTRQRIHERFRHALHPPTPPAITPAAA